MNLGVELHPTSWWQGEQLVHTLPHRTPYVGGVHFWEQLYPKYPMGHSTKNNAKLHEYGLTFNYFMKHFEEKKIPLHLSSTLK